MLSLLEWHPHADATTDGRFSIHSEQVRGEPRFYWLVCHGLAARAEYERLGLDGSYDKRTVRRQAERIARNLADGPAVAAPTLTDAQQRTLDYLQASGHASARALSRHLWGHPRYTQRAALLLDRLVAYGLATRESLPAPAPLHRWHAVDPNPTST